jgi:putative drug exporter of the RND superfamily
VVAAVTIAVLATFATGLLGTRIGLSQTEQFRVRADSVSGYDVVAAHFPAGLTNPTLVIAPTAQARKCGRRSAPPPVWSRYPNPAGRHPG